MISKHMIRVYEDTVRRLGWFGLGLGTNEGEEKRD